MNELAKEWVHKAEADFVSCGRELRARKNPNYDDACFHAQQCAEKYLKAFMTLHNLRFERTHDLLKLLNGILPTFAEFELIQDLLSALNQYAVEPRYPEFNAERAEAKTAYHHVKDIREFVRARMDLPLD